MSGDKTLSTISLQTMVGKGGKEPRPGSPTHVAFVGAICMSQERHEKNPGLTIVLLLPLQDDAEKKERPLMVVDMSTIELRAEDLYDKEKVDLEAVDLEDVYRLLQANQSGLSSAEVTRRLELFGPNKIESEEQNAILQFLSFMWNPLS